MSRVVQLKYFNLAAWPREVTEVSVGAAVAAAEFGLPTNIGSRHATLAAKNAWMQCRTAKRLENSSSWPKKKERNSIIQVQCSLYPYSTHFYYQQNPSVEKTLPLNKFLLKLWRALAPSPASLFLSLSPEVNTTKKNKKNKQAACHTTKKLLRENIFPINPQHTRLINIRDQF